MARFGRFFSGQLFDVYGGVFARPPCSIRMRRRARSARCALATPEVHYFNTEDNVRLRLTRYQGGKKGPVILAHGLGVSSLAFATDLIDTNMTEYLFAHGYDVWLLDYRSSIELPYATTQYTADDVAMCDWPAAVKTVLDSRARRRCRRSCTAMARSRLTWRCARACRACDRRCVRRWARICR